MEVLIIVLLAIGIVFLFESKAVTQYSYADLSEQEFEQKLEEEGFPESYKPYLRELHRAHPAWIFKGAKTNISFNDAVLKESAVGMSLVHPTVPEAWKSMEKGAYSFISNKYISYDSGGWVTGTKDIVKYYMDPRNFMDERGIFQFLTHGFDETSQSLEGLELLLKGTFMEGSFPEEGFTNWAEAIYSVGREEQVNPYVIASMILVEQGTNGIGQCISGTVSGYEGIYNFFNIGAYRSGGMTAVQRGLWYASNSGSYLRPWDSRYKSIKGGANFYAGDYVLRNQNTLYTKKWNVMNGLNSVATHQYMGNLQGADLEALQLKKGYVKIMENPMTFIIPIYSDMPEKTYKNNIGNNNNFLQNLEVSGYKLNKEFNRYDNEYQVKVSDNDTDCLIIAKAESEQAEIIGSGQVKLSGIETSVTIKVKSTSGDLRSYKLKILRDNVVSPQPKPSQEEIDKVKNTKIKARTKVIDQNGKKSIVLTWQNLNSTELDGYNIYVSNFRYKGYGRSPLVRLSGDIKSYEYKGKLIPGKTYYFKVVGHKTLDKIKYKTKQSNKTWKTIKENVESISGETPSTKPSTDNDTKPINDGETPSSDTNITDGGNKNDTNPSKYDNLSDKEREIVEGIENTTIKAKSELISSPKPAIDIFWNKSKGFRVDYYQVFRSVKKNSGYGNLPIFVTADGYDLDYTNTKNLRIGIRYYYKIRGVRQIGNNTYYTQFSNKVYRTI